jgi:hypothetical protein
MCYTRFGAYPNHMHITIIVKKWLVKKKKKYKGANVRARRFNAGLLARSQFASGRSYDWPIQSRFSVVFLGPRTNAELVPKFQVALHASHAALKMVTLKIKLYANVTLTSGCITLFTGDMSEGALHREERNCQTKKLKSPVPRWTDYYRLQRQADTWQTRPLVREGAPIKDKTVTFKKKKKTLVKCPIFGLDTKTYWLTDWPSVAMWLWLWLEDELADWPLVAI